MNCINTSSSDFKTLLEQSKLNSLHLETIISKWQDINGLDKFPTVEEVLENKGDLNIKAKYFPNGNKNTVKDVLQRMSVLKHKLSPLAKQLIAYSNVLDTQIELVEDDDSRLDKVAAAHYDRKSNRILIKTGVNFKGIGSEPTLLHEIIHALTVKELVNNPNSKEVQDLNKMYEHVKKHISGDVYGMKDINEFVAELFTNDDFINQLKDIPSIDSVKYKNLFEEFFDMILKALGITKGSTLYEQAFAVSTNIIDNQYNKFMLEKEAMQLADAESVFGAPIFEKAKTPINKKSKLWKRLNPRLPVLQAEKLYNILNSDGFKKWYGNGKRDSDGNPYIDYNYEFINDKGERLHLRNDIEFSSIEEVERFFSSNKTVGISKYKSGKYYISKNQRIRGVEWINHLEKQFPGLITLKQYNSTSEALGGTDQSMPIIRIELNENYFNGVFNSEVATETKVKEVEDPRQYVVNRLVEANVRIENRLKDAKRDVKNGKAKNNSEVIKYEKLFEKNKENIANLKVDLTKANILNQAKIDLEMINKSLSKGSLTTEELSEIGNLIDLYKDIASTKARSGILEKEDFDKRLITVVDKDGVESDIEDITQLTKDIKQVGSDYQLLEEIYDNLIKEVVTKEYNKQRGTNESVEELFKDTKDLGLLAGSRDSGSTNNRLVQLLHFVRSNASQRANSETLAAQQEREKMSDGLKKSKLFKNKQDFMLKYHQKDEDGNHTGGLVDELSHKYQKYKENFYRILESKDKSKIAKAKKDYYNHHEYINYFDNEGDKNVEIYRLKDALKIDLDRATELVENQALKFEEYRKRKDEKEEDINGEDLTDLEKELELHIWELQNNPTYTIENLKNGTVTSNPKGGNIYNSFEFVKSIPLKEIDGKETGFYDKAYEEIKNDEVAFEYYKYVKNTIKDLLRQYPSSYLSEKGIHEGFIPMITKKLLSDIVKGGKKSIMSNIVEITRELYSTKIFSKTHNHIKVGTNDAMNTLNISMLSPRYETLENGERVITDDIITDLDDILKAFIPVTNLYKHKSRVESSYNLIADSIKLLKGTKETPTGVLVRNSNNEKLESNLDRLKSIVEHEVDTFYGKNKKESAGARKYYTEKDKEVKLKLEKKQEEIKSQLENPELLTEVEEAKLRKQLIDNTNTIDDLGKNASGSKLLRSVLKYYQYITQSWNLPSSFIELTYGTMSNRTTAAAGIDYTSKQIARAYRLAHTAVVAGGLDKNSNKFNNIIEKLNIIGDVHESDKNGAINSNKKKFGIKNVYKPFYFQLLADKYSKGSSAVATMMNTFIKDINGNEVNEKNEKFNLYDSLDENGELLPQFKSEENLEAWTLNTNSTEANEFLRLRSKIIQINNRNHGNYDPDSPIPWLKTAGGEAIFQFRRWMIEGVASRWEHDRPDDNLGRIVRGRYRTYMKVYSNKEMSKAATTGHLFILMASKLIPGQAGKNIFNKQLEELGLNEATDIENMRKNAQGIMFILAIWLMMLLLQGLADDDEDKDFSSLNFLVNMGGRLQQDLWFYANPGEGSSLIQNAVPVMKLYDKLDTWSEAVYQTLFETDPEYNTVYQSGTFKGWDKWLIKTGELFPGSAAIIKDTRLGDKAIQ